MKIISNSTLSVCAVALLATFSPSISSAAITTQLCIDIGPTHGGSDGTNIFAELTGTKGSTGRLSLDNQGQDDFKAKQWNCFYFPEADLVGNNGRDVGFHTQLEMGFNAGDQDDFCVKGIHSRRWENWNPKTLKGKELSISQFGSANEMCFGNYNNKSLSVRKLTTSSRPPSAKIRQAKAAWVKVGSIKGVGALKFSTTWGATRTLETTKTQDWNIAATVAIEAEAGAPGNSVKTSASITASVGGSRSISNAVGLTEAKTIEVLCNNKGEEAVITLYQREYSVVHSDGTPAVVVPVKDFECRKG